LRKLLRGAPGAVRERFFQSRHDLLRRERSRAMGGEFGDLQPTFARGRTTGENEESERSGAWASHDYFIVALRHDSGNMGNMNLLLIGIGGALGAIARYGAGLAVESLRAEVFPWATFAVNMLGCLALGGVLGVQARFPENTAIWPLGAVGFLGAFTTFSAFSFNNLQLLEGGRAGLAAINTVAQVSLGVAAVWVGRLLSA
jgi:CrcB protein